MDPVVEPEPAGVITVRPGDRLIFRFTHNLTVEDGARIRAEIERRIGTDIPFLILGDGVEITVLRREDGPE